MTLQNLFHNFKIDSGEADFAVVYFNCNEPEKRIICLPALHYLPYYFFTRYPLETTKVWNLFKLLTPTSWIWTFSAIVVIVFVLKCFTLIGTSLGCITSVQDVTLVPIRYYIHTYK